MLRILRLKLPKLLVFLALMPGYAYTDLPKKADVAKIYNIEQAGDQPIDVRFYRKGECDNQQWCAIKGEGEYLKGHDFLQTGQISRADLALMYSGTGSQYNEVLFWQQEGSRSQFEPKEGTCHFRIEVGRFLYAHPHQSVNPGCEKILSKNALIIPNGTALFVYGSKDETVVGVLSNRPQGLITVQHLNSSNKVALQAGEYAKALQNGQVIKDRFDLEEFYKKNPIALGLGPEDKDEDYVSQQEPKIQEILNKLRDETVTAMEQQDKSLPTKPIDTLPPPSDPTDRRQKG